MNIYLDIDGTLIHEDLTNNYGKPARGLEEFLIALRPHNTYWLTTHCTDGDPTSARRKLKAVLPKRCYPDIDRIKPTMWNVFKTEGIDWSTDFIWFDNDISDQELKRFASARPNQQVFEVNLKNHPTHLIEITNDVLASL
jgi:hypothetical protein